MAMLLILILPSNAVNVPVRSLNNVDFPEPDAPTINTFSPSLILKETSCKTCFPSGYLKFTPLKPIAIPFLLVTSSLPLSSNAALLMLFNLVNYI